MILAIETVVLVINFNGLKHLQECLASLKNQTYQKTKILVVDDGSTDASLNFIQTNFPAMEILALKTNCGFAKAVNDSINYALDKYQPTYLAILNNDTKVDQDWLKNLIRAIEIEENIVAVASNMLFYNHPNLINSQGSKFTFSGQGLDINFQKKISEVKIFPKYVLASCWGATLLRSETLNKIGLLDENYYAYLEDLDWGYRANLLGYKIIFEPKALVFHKGSAFWENYQFKKIYLCERNSLYTIIKNYELKNIIKVLPLVILNYFIFYPGGYLLNRKIESYRLVPLFKEAYPLLKRLKFSLIPLRAIFWNLKHLPRSLRLRKKIQTTRTTPDQEIFPLSNQL